MLDGTIVRIAPLGVLAEEEAQKRKLADEQALGGELHVLTKTLSYAKAEELQAADHQERAVAARHGAGRHADQHADHHRPAGSAEHRRGAASNTLDTRAAAGGNRGAHRPDQQGLRPAARRAVGLQRPCRSGARQHHESGVPEQRQRRRARRADAPTTGPGRGPRSTCGVAGATSAVGLALGSVNGAFNLDVALSALESSGNGRILSTPRVSTQNNVEAEITQGIQIPIQTVVEQHRDRDVQGRGADAEGDAADHRGRHGDHEDRGRERRARFLAAPSDRA